MHKPNKKNLKHDTNNISITMNHNNKKDQSKLTHRQNQMLTEIKYKEKLVKRKNLIQKLFLQSVSNQIYIFPRSSNPIKLPDDSTSSSDSEILSNSYSLKQQNKKDQSHQIHFLQNKNKKLQKNNYLQNHNQIVSINQTKKVIKNPSNYHSVNNQSKKTNEKQQKIEKYYYSKGRINSTDKFPYVQLSNDKKSTKHLYSSQKSCRNYPSQNENSKSIIISFRGTKKHDINVSLTRKRLKTQN